MYCKVKAKVEGRLGGGEGVKGLQELVGLWGGRWVEGGGGVRG